MLKNVAFVTYNSVGDGLPSGWHDGPNDRRSLVLQNTRGDRWLVSPNTPKPESVAENEALCDRRQVEIDTLWGKLQEELSELDHLVVYIGAGGSERAIALVAQLPASKLTFVACDCGLEYKEIMIQSAGLATVGRLLCECGGRQTMRMLFEHFIETGELSPV